MSERTTGRWLLVVLAVAGLALTVSVVSAHGNKTTTDDAPSNNGTAANWAVWMEAHMTQHIGPNAVKWMDSQMGMTVEQMIQNMTDHDHVNHAMADQRHGC